MNIVKQKWFFLNSTVFLVPKQVKKLYIFGAQSLALRRIESLRANARLFNLNWHTAKSKIYRLTINQRLSLTFPKLLIGLNLVNPKDVLVVDFSDFGNDFQVLIFAKQTRKGRTIPVYFEILRYPIEKNSQNTFIIQAIIHFEQIVGFKPKLVFDRGFASPSIIRFLAQNHWIFYIRIKQKKSIRLADGTKILAKNSPLNDCKVQVYELRLRLIVSDSSPDLDEPWYLITNDFRSSREKIISIYYHRFEVEEFFRDAKRLLGLEHVYFQKELSLTVTLWFIILGLWFVWDLEQKLLANDAFEKRQREQRQLSIIRYCYEKIQSEIILAAEGEYLRNTG
jgi:hypothetical protein